jgi:DNA-binding HxlR family transcriptional regulator
MAVVNSDDPGPLASAVARVGDRWVLLLVDALLDGPRRFNELQEELAGIATNVLAQRLRHLEAEGIAVARPYSRRPPRFVYELTAAGRDLAGALRLLTQWGADHGGGHVSGTAVPSVAAHAACGTPLEARWYCPTCARIVEEDEPATVQFL